MLAYAVTARLNSLGVISLREGENVSISLEAENNSPFSPLVTFQWMYNGVKINASQIISLNGYRINILDVQRGDIGEYLLVVTNSAGYGEGNFTLNVLCKLLCYQIALHNLACVQYSIS